MPGPLKLKTMSKRFFWMLPLGVLVFFLGCKPSGNEISLIPLPAEMQLSGPGFTIGTETRLVYDNSELESIAHISSELWKSYLGYELPLEFTEERTTHSVAFTLNEKYDETLGDEGYRLDIQKGGVVIAANKPAGILYGAQTVYQLLSTHPDGKLPGLQITDYPRFGYRGLHLDVSRHFHPMEFIYKMIDQMAKHKLNVFHWHLIDDQGWRLEIKKYPKLTEVGAWRVDMSHLHWDARPLTKDPGNATYGGYYTQEEVRELVAYAAERNITIMPEIEMPAHVMSALAAYPEFSCTGENLGVPPGGVWPITHIYCAGNDATFEFLENVMLEVMELFPSEFIHIGGDEADKTNWKSCPRCQARIQNEGLKDEEELQSYFIARMERFLNAHGRKLMGWDEILEGGLAPNATVMSWRGEAGGIEAAKMGHTVVMTPGSHCYFDHYQGDPDIEPLAIHGYTTLAKVYSYEPIPAELTSEEGKLVLGAQANVWTEFMPDSRHVEYMIFPRLAALSEVVWSPAANRDWGDFSKRMQTQYKRYEKQDINYSLSAFQVRAIPEVNLDKKSLRIALDTDVYNPEIRYTTDGSEPNVRSPLYTGPFEIDQTTAVKAMVIENGKSMEQVMKREYYLHKAFAGDIQMKHPNSEQYDGHGQHSLVNGIRGTVSFSDGNWKGFLGNDLVATIDLGQTTSITSVSVDALHNYASWIFLPQWVSFEVSSDGEEFRLLEKVDNTFDIQDTRRNIRIYSTQTAAEEVRYVRVTVKSQGVCPPGHSGEGKPAWLFVSEIVVD
ncbi:MAG: beta-N-acetylhexosaminidase [Bacteroidetes bacterium]|nr:MAG: beta-N-acetylhexosaminidase [Bacteroidota bacterium]